MSRIFVTGVGIITPLGDTLSLNHEALKQSICGISKLELIDSIFTNKLPVGEIKTETKTLKEKLNVNQAGVTRTMLLALHAFKEAVNDGGLSAEIISSKDTALIGATTVGGMCLTNELYIDANKKSNGSEYLSSYDAGSITMYLQEKYGMRGIINTINTACSSSANSIMYGARLLQNGFAKRAIVGGVDSLAKFTINGFNALHILSNEICRPFDNERKGLNLSEGAAFLVLENEENIGNKKVYAELTGYCNANDAFHPSSLSENADGPFLAMQGALQKANLQPAQIDFINVHGTATENNDEAESKAMLRLFDKIPPFASTKSNIGHTLGAAGAIEAVYSILNLTEQEVYKSLNYKNAIALTGLIPVSDYKKMPIKNVLSNSFGFGGNCSSLIFSKA